MDAKRLFCLVLLASLLSGCGPRAATPQPTATAVPLLLRQPWGIFVDSDGRIYVADTDNDRIVRLDDASGTYWTAYGSRGSGEGQFKGPMDVFVDSGGKIYIADQQNHRIVRMDDMRGSNWTTIGSKWTVTGGSGSGSGQFNSPTGIFVAGDGKIYVADYSNNRIVRMDDMSGSNWTVYGSQGGGDGQLSSTIGVRAISVDSDGRIYAAEVGNNRIVRIDDMTGSNWTAYGSAGSGNGQFDIPLDICLDSAGRIYVADGNNRLVRMDNMSGSNWTTCGSYGTGARQFRSAHNVFVDSAGKIYVSDGAGRVVRMDDINGTNWMTFP